MIFNLYHIDIFISYLILLVYLFSFNLFSIVDTFSSLSSSILLILVFVLVALFCFLYFLGLILFFSKSSIIKTLIFSVFTFAISSWACTFFCSMSSCNFLIVSALSFSIFLISSSVENFDWNLTHFFD